MPKRSLLPIENEFILLRLLEKADLPLTLSWRNQEHIRKWFLNTDLITEERHSAWYERYIEMANDFVFLILAKELDNTPVGQISLYGIDWQAGSAEYGRLMIGDQAAKGRGFAKQATRLLLEYGFREMGLREIHLEVKEDNAAAVAIYKATGFLERSSEAGLLTMSITPQMLHCKNEPM